MFAVGQTCRWCHDLARGGSRSLWCCSGRHCQVQPTLRDSYLVRGHTSLTGTRRLLTHRQLDGRCTAPSERTPSGLNAEAEAKAAQVTTFKVPRSVLMPISTELIPQHHTSSRLNLPAQETSATSCSRPPCTTWPQIEIRLFRRRASVTLTQLSHTPMQMPTNTSPLLWPECHPVASRANHINYEHIQRYLRRVCHRCVSLRSTSSPVSVSRTAGVCS